MGIDLGPIDKAIDEVVIEMGGSIVEARAKVLIQVDQALVLSTPVLTGRAAGNWLPSLGVPDTDYLQNIKDPTGVVAMGKARILANSLIDDHEDIYISNNAPYIGALNDGHSKKAPRNFIPIAVQAAKESLR